MDCILSDNNIFLNMDKRVIIAFDFDGTITTKDTLIAFIRFSKGKFNLFLGFLLYSPLLIAYKLKLYPNWKIKQKIFSYFFKGTNLLSFNKICEDFSKHSQGLIRPKATKVIRAYIEKNYELVIISASIENWVKPFARKLGISDIICTKPEIDSNNNLTGFFSTPNCYGIEKVNRLIENYPMIKDYYLIAYGDSEGDKELLDFADEKYYREFE